LNTGVNTSLIKNAPVLTWLIYCDYIYRDVLEGKVAYMS